MNQKQFNEVEITEEIEGNRAIDLSTHIGKPDENEPTDGDPAAYSQACADELVHAAHMVQHMWDQFVHEAYATVRCPQLYARAFKISELMSEFYQAASYDAWINSTDNPFSE